MKGILCTTDNRFVVKDYDEPLYKTLGADVEGWIEVIQIINDKRIHRPYVFICNEAFAILEGFDLNRIGTELYGDIILGNIVIMKEGMTDEGPDLVGLDEADLRFLTNQLKSHYVRDDIEGDRYYGRKD